MVQSHFLCQFHNSLQLGCRLAHLAHCWELLESGMLCAPFSRHISCQLLSEKCVGKHAEQHLDVAFTQCALCHICK